MAEDPPFDIESFRADVEELVVTLRAVQIRAKVHPAETPEHLADNLRAIHDRVTRTLDAWQTVKKP